MLNDGDTEQYQGVPLRLEPGFTAGLASALVGATVFLASPIIAILAVQVWAHGDRSRGVVEMHAWLARIAVGLPTLLIVAGLWYATIAGQQTKTGYLSRALPVIGVLLNISGLMAWIIAAYALLNTTESMLRMAR